MFVIPETELDVELVFGARPSAVIACVVPQAIPIFVIVFDVIVLGDAMLITEPPEPIAICP